MVPSAATAMLGRKACRSAKGMSFGVRLTAMGSDQESPPSSDWEKAMLLYWPLLKRLSSHTAQRAPLCRSTAAEAIAAENSLTKTPVSGSVAPISGSAELMDLISG